MRLLSFTRLIVAFFFDFWGQKKRGTVHFNHLLTFRGSGKPFPLIRYEQFTPKDVNPRKLILREIYQTSEK